MNCKRFADILAVSGVVNESAIEDPEGFDGGYTMDCIRQAWDRLQDAREAERKE